MVNMIKLEAAKEKSRRASANYYAVLNYYGDSDDAHEYFYGKDDRRRKHANDLYLAAEVARKELLQVDSSRREI